MAGRSGEEEFHSYAETVDVYNNNNNNNTSKSVCADFGDLAGYVSYVTDIRNSSGAANLTRYIQVEDLIRVPGPITEHSLLKTLQARFYNGKYYVSTTFSNSLRFHLYMAW